MNLYLLRPLDPLPEAFTPWYDKAFGFVVRAPSEAKARELADAEGGDESHDGQGNPWLDPLQTSCVPINGDGPEEVIIRDYASA